MILTNPTLYVLEIKGHRYALGHIHSIIDTLTAECPEMSMYMTYDIPEEISRILYNRNIALERKHALVEELNNLALEKETYSFKIFVLKHHGASSDRHYVYDGDDPESLSNMCTDAVACSGGVLVEDSLDNIRARTPEPGDRVFCLSKSTRVGWRVNELDVISADGHERDATYKYTASTGLVRIFFNDDDLNKRIFFIKEDADRACEKFNTEDTHG